MNHTNFFSTRALIIDPIATIIVLWVALLVFPTAGSAEPTRAIARSEIIQKMSSESEEQFVLRKQRITYGTTENRRYCKEELGINVGLCKGGAQSACFMTDLYKAWCVALGENADAAVAKLPARSREDYFDHRDGRWLTRVEYCSWLAQQPVRRRSASWHRDLFEKNCGELPRGNDTR